LAESKDRGKQRPSDVLLYSVPPKPGLIAKCAALGSSADSALSLSMVFSACINKQPVKVMFDSGSTNCFVKKSLIADLGLWPHPSNFKAFVAADGGSGQIHGSVDIPSLRWNLGLETPVSNVMVLDDLLPGVDMILGEDFLTDQHVVLDYMVGKASLGRLRRVGIDCSSSFSCETGGTPCAGNRLSIRGGRKGCDEGCVGKRKKEGVGGLGGSGSKLRREAAGCPAISGIQASRMASRMVRGGCVPILVMVRQKSVISASIALSDWKSMLPDMSRVPLALKEDFMAVLEKHSAIFANELPPEDQQASAFSTPQGHFEWKVLSLGLTNAPGVFLACHV
ncbi:hypothetical protein CEUSTIGMA_g14039.t1, partial [Chlamydomonas eustigma]